MERITTGCRFWATKYVGSSSIAEEIIKELEKIGATNMRYDGLDDFMFLGNIPSNKRRQLRKYLKNIGCTPITIEKSGSEQDNFWYRYDECGNRRLRLEIAILVLFAIMFFIMVGVAKIL